LAYFAIDGSMAIEIKVSPLLILTFGLPPMDPASIYTGNVAVNLAAFLGIDPEKIRRVKIISAASPK
jgi:hypothetical protein